MLYVLLATAFADTVSWSGSAAWSAGTASGITSSSAGLSLTADSGWYSASWPYRVPIDITESSGSAQTDYTLLVEVDTASLISGGYLRSSGADIRFVTEAGTVLDHWVESGLGTTSTEIW